MDGNEGAEAPVDEISGRRSCSTISELPRAVLGRWCDHLDRFFARHGGARRYGALAALVAEARAASQPSPAGGARG